MPRIVLAIVFAFTIVSVERPSRAATITAARHYIKGMEQLKVGQFTEAAASFEAAFDLDPSPPLLWNAARAHHKAGTLERALQSYERFMVMDGVKTERREKAVAYSKEIRQALEAEKARRAAELDRDRRAKELESMKRELSKEVLSELRRKAPPEKKVIVVLSEPTDWSTPGWTTLGVGVAASAASLTLLLLAQDAHSASAKPNVDVEGVVIGQTQTEAADLQEKANDFNTASLLLGVAGGFALSTGVILLLLGEDGPSVTAIPTRGGVALSAGGTF